LPERSEVVIVQSKLPLNLIGFLKLLICTANNPAILMVIWQAAILTDELTTVDEEAVVSTDVLADSIISIGS
jgi:hypothetical protein